MTKLVGALASLLLLAGSIRADDGPFEVFEDDGRLGISCLDGSFGSYFFRDPKTPRPYFANICPPNDSKVTRHHPPRPGIDAVDHDTMHPGIWLSFGDLGGADFWRNKAQVKFVEMTSPQPRDGVVSFLAKFRYLDGDKEICTETARHTICLLDQGTLLTYDSTFSGREAFVFGDQEEMGLGVRMATRQVVKGGTGTVTNSGGGKNEKEVWGKQADWCDYSGTGSGRHAGVLLIPHQDNFRRSWFHVRDYGLMVANPFGQNAFTKGEKSRVEVKPGERFSLRFGVWIYSVNAGKTPDYAEIAKEYHRLTDKR
jgi:hypothetical protein